MKTYTERLEEVLRVVRTRVANSMGELITCDIIDTALKEGVTMHQQRKAVGEDDRALRYVCGFLMTDTEVLLIKKAKPEWQHGLLNGIGGRIEDEETDYAAMCREFGEETGHPLAGWVRYHVEYWPLTGVEVVFYYKMCTDVSLLYEARDANAALPHTDERAEIHAWRCASTLAPDQQHLIYNLPYLFLMAWQHYLLAQRGEFWYVPGLPMTARRVYQP